LVHSRRPKSLLATLAATIALLTVMVMPASAITRGGEADDGRHPHVGQLLFYVPDYPASRYGPEDPGAWFTCTGTLTGPSFQFVVTAGHCTFAVGNGGQPTTETTDGRGGNDVWISFADEPNFGILGASSSFTSNAARYAQWSTALNASAEWTRGTADTHPDYSDAAFFRADLGAVVLEDAVDSGGRYATLPADSQLNALKPGQRTTFTTVGYGMNRSFPPGTPADIMLSEDAGIRMVAYPQLQRINVPGYTGDFAMMLSSNASTGGTCFGDSGGPNFLDATDVLAGVTSFGLTYTCAGTSGVYRVDGADDLGWLYRTFGAYLP
jgi:hypothetical protein